MIIIDNEITKCESLVVNVTGSWGSPDGQLYATLPATWINFDPVRAKSIKLSLNVSAENSTYSHKWNQNKITVEKPKKGKKKISIQVEMVAKFINLFGEEKKNTTTYR